MDRIHFLVKQLQHGAGGFRLRVAVLNGLGPFISIVQLLDVLAELWMLQSLLHALARCTHQSRASDRVISTGDRIGPDG